MAQIFRKEPAPTATAERPKPKQAAPTGGVQQSNSLFGRLRRSFDDIVSELRKVTWPTQEETRNLTIVVIGISVVLGAFLGGIDFVLSGIYKALSGFGG